MRGARDFKRLRSSRKSAMPAYSSTTQRALPGLWTEELALSVR